MFVRNVNALEKVYLKENKGLASFISERYPYINKSFGG